MNSHDELKIVADLHTHTIASDHAYCTVTEMAQAAADAGLKAIGITDHGPALVDAPHIYYFQNLSVLPRTINNVLVFRGAEVNIIDEDGNTDLPEREMSQLDYTIASLHTPVYIPKSKKAHTNTLLNVIENPYVKILGHTGRCKCELDIPQVLRKARTHNVAIEINTNSLSMSPDIAGRCAEILETCRELNVPVVLSSDAHFKSRVGDFGASLKMLNDFDFPVELVVNTSIEKITEFFKINI